MTQPQQPLISLASLRSWTQETIPDNDPLATMILMGVSIKLWQYGDSSWTPATIPAGAKLIGELKAKNFWQHPTGASREQVDVISESFINDVLLHLNFTDTEIAELASLAGPDDGSAPNLGIWVIETTRGALETHQRSPRGTAYYDTSWADPFPLLPDSYFLGPR